MSPTRRVFGVTLGTGLSGFGMTPLRRCIREFKLGGASSYRPAGLAAPVPLAAMQTPGPLVSFPPGLVERCSPESAGACASEL